SLEVTLYDSSPLYPLDLSAHRVCLAPTICLARHRHIDRHGQGHATAILVENNPCAQCTGWWNPSAGHRWILSLASPQFRIDGGLLGIPSQPLFHLQRRSDCAAHRFLVGADDGGEFGGVNPDWRGAVTLANGVAPPARRNQPA